LFGAPDWNSTYNPQGLGRDDGNFGPEFKRDSVRGSPVVPGSAVKVYADGDAILYSIIVLKGHYVAGVLEGEEFTTGNKYDIPLCAPRLYRSL